MIPMANWENEFSENMPEDIREAILKARGEGSNTGAVRRAICSACVILT
jgi:hypothetical protein